MAAAVGLLLKSLIILCILTCYLSASKYSKTKNLGPDDRSKLDNPFRANKVNQVWQKARKRLKEKKLMEIYDDLKIQDDDEMNLKKTKLKDGDPDGEKEAEVRQNLHDIMIKYRLIDPKHDDTRNSVEHDFQKDVFLDSRLKKMWKSAIQSGFSDSELDDLRREFEHHQMKIDEYEQLKDEDSNNKEGDMENSLDRFKEDDSGKLKKEKRTDFHVLKKEIKEGYERLERKTSHTSDSEFTEPRVFEMWSQALKANFTEKELLSFKEELKHFERKIQKHRYMKEQAEISAKKAKHVGKVKDDSFEGPQKWQYKADDYAYKVKKLEHELSTKVKKALGEHSEL